MCEAASLCRLNVYSVRPSLSLNNSVLFMLSLSHTHKLTHFAIPLALRVCCQPLLLICTRHAGKKKIRISLHCLFLHYDPSFSFHTVSLTLAFSPSRLIFDFIFLLIFHPSFFLSARHLTLSFCLSCISKCKAGKHILLLQKFCL